MQKEDPEEPRSRPLSRRNSSQSRRSSIKKDKSFEKTSPHSATSTPKKTPKVGAGVERSGLSGLDFIVTGKQITKRCDRANSLPGAYHRRTSVDSINPRAKKLHESPKRNTSQASRSRETSLEDDMSLDLSQVSDFEDTNSKYGITHKHPLATSTPKPRPGPKPRSASLQSHIQRVETRRTQKSLDSGKSRDSVFSCSRDSLHKTSSSASPYKYGTDLDYSSVSPEYSGQSSVDLSPRAPTTDLVVSPRSQNASSCCVSSWQDCSEGEPTKVEGIGGFRGEGEWNDFWANYNNSLSKVPMKSYYDQCPTPYRTENIDLNDFDFTIDGSRKRSPDNITNLNNIIRNEGLQLTPRETQNIIKCAHILGNVLSKAIERRSRENEITTIEELASNNAEEKEIETKKKNLTLDLKETATPQQAQEEKRSETVTTQTDISLPNTKSAPRIFESILRQLSKSSIDEADENVGVVKVDKIEEKKD